MLRPGETPLRLGPRAAGADYRPPERRPPPPTLPSGPSLSVHEPYVAALELGSVGAPITLAVVRRQAGASKLDPVVFTVAHLRRWPRRTATTLLAQEVRALLEREPLAEQTGAALFDITGVGRMAFDALVDPQRAYPTYPLPVWVAASGAAHQDAEGWHVPRLDLTAAVSLLLEQRRLKVAPLPLANELKAQLGTWALPAAGAARDLMTAVALACWWGQEISPPRVEDVPDPNFHAWSPEALRLEEERGRRIRPYLPPEDWPMIEGV